MLKETNDYNMPPTPQRKLSKEQQRAWYAQIRKNLEASGDIKPKEHGTTTITTN